MNQATGPWHAVFVNEWLMRRFGCPRLLYDIHHADDGGYPLGIVIDQRAIDRLEASRAANREHQGAGAFSAYSIGSNRQVILIELVSIFTLVSAGHGFAGSIATDDSDDVLAENAE